MSRSLQRLVRSQILFREVNERVRETIGSFGGPIDFLCECSQEDCTESVELDMEEYERIRSNANLFVVVTGHEMVEVDRVVDQGNRYVLVEKIVAVDEVVSADPRSRGG